MKKFVKDQLDKKGWPSGDVTSLAERNRRYARKYYETISDLPVDAPLAKRLKQQALPEQY